LFVRARSRGPCQTTHGHVFSLCLANSPVSYGLVADLSQIALVATQCAFLERSLPPELSPPLRFTRCHELRLSTSSPTHRYLPKLMRTYQSLQKGRNRFGQQEEMATQTPKAASSKTSSFRSAEHGFPVLPPNAVVMDVGADRPASTWHNTLACREAPSSEEVHRLEHGIFAAPPSTPHYLLDVPEELARMLMTMYPGSDGELNGEELAEAFREGSELPPITKQSLSELDIQHIIKNIKLRHDINFDQDLSFRPNLDGMRGQEKGRAMRRYWKALVSELELYARLFQGTPTLKGPADPPRVAHIQHAKRRIPVLFETIQEVLKSLVPDRDHARVDERLDVPMLMQEIERGVCDLVRLAEWMAQLLKEHCAPMRDVWVDEMVSKIREGVADRSSEGIVCGLNALLGILEAMKLVGSLYMLRMPILISF
jgi:hypothetical protein